MNNKLNMVLERITNAANRYQRTTSDIKLIGAGKTQSSETIREVYAAGLEAIGENYLQEAILKQKDLQDCKLQWHFIGGIQSNKTKELAEHFDWVQGIDRFKIARRLNQHRQQKHPLQVLIQLNIDQEDSKQGVSASEFEGLCLQISELENLTLRGLMLIPRPSNDFDQQRRPFAQARELLEQINQHHSLEMDTLSMGMSSDLEAAIAEGSTMVRIGTDLFGKRN